MIKIGGTVLSQRIMGIARRLLPKQFFQCLNQRLGLRKKSALVKHFKSEIIEGEIKEPPSLSNYLESLYSSQDIIDPINHQELNPIHLITTEQLDRARKKMAKGKAVGIDELKDIIIKNDEIWTKVKGKVLDQFNHMLAKGRSPRYFKKGRIVPLSKDENNS